jgi:4-carboxymuconolactone decarboxylase
MDMQKEQAAIFPGGDQAPPAYFVGSAWIRILVPEDETGTYAVGNVYFEPGSRNSWHTHGAGQILLITAGTGFYQERGQTARRISGGDIVIIPSGVEHWHGASEGSSLTHIAITNKSVNGLVTWLEPVSDSDYQSVQ